MHSATPIVALYKKWSFLLKIYSVNVTNLQETADLVTFLEQILNGKLHFFCSVVYNCSRNFYHLTAIDFKKQMCL